MGAAVQAASCCSLLFTVASIHAATAAYRITASLQLFASMSEILNRPSRGAPIGM
jgi:hypothetical protein